jgi:phage anti-repressor protein
MILDIRKLKKVDDILNSEGTILGLYKIDDQILLGSFLKDHSGMVYYLTSIEILKKYFNSEIILEQVYLESEDFIVTRQYRKETVSFIKEDLVTNIQCGDKLFSQISNSMRNDKLAKEFYSS